MEKRCSQAGVFGYFFSGRCCTLHHRITVGIWPLKLSLVSLNYGSFQDYLLEINLASTRRHHKMRWDSFSSSEGTIVPCCLFSDYIIFRASQQTAHILQRPELMGSSYFEPSDSSVI